MVTIVTAPVRGCARCGRRSPFLFMLEEPLHDGFVCGSCANDLRAGRELRIVHLQGDQRNFRYNDPAEAPGGDTFRWYRTTACERGVPLLPVGSEESATTTSREVTCPDCQRAMREGSA